MVQYYVLFYFLLHHRKKTFANAAGMIQYENHGRAYQNILRFKISILLQCMAVKEKPTYKYEKNIVKVT